MVDSIRRPFAPRPLPRSDARSDPRSDARQNNVGTSAASANAQARPAQAGASAAGGVGPEPATPGRDRPVNALALRHEWKLFGGRSRTSSAPPEAPPAPQNFKAARQQLQQALDALQAKPNDPQRQEAAHQAQLALANQAMPRLHRGLPLLKETLRIGLAGSVPTFGVGRTLGVEAGTRAVSVGPQPGLKNIQRAGAQWVSGAVGGAVGHLAGQTLLAPLVDMLPQQFKPVHPSAILPDRMVAKMNRLRPGWGDETRAAVAQQQQEVSRINSDTNIHFAEKAFGAATAVRMLAQPPGVKLNLAQSVAIGSATSGAAGAAVGANLAGNMARAEVRVPRMDTLDRLLASRPKDRPDAAALTDVAMEDAQSLPLFYAHHTPASERSHPAAAIANHWHRNNLREPAPLPQQPNDRVVFPDWGAQATHAMADVRNLGDGVVSRSGHLMRATAGPAALSAAQPFVNAAMPNAEAMRASATLSTVVGIYSVIRPWFNALAGGVPAGDAAVRAKRQKAAEEAAAANVVAPAPVPAPGPSAPPPAKR